MFQSKAALCGFTPLHCIAKETEYWGGEETVNSAPVSRYFIPLSCVWFGVAVVISLTLEDLARASHFLDDLLIVSTPHSTILAGRTQPTSGFHSLLIDLR